MCFQWIYCKTTRVCRFISINRTIRLLACFGLLFGVVVMSIGLWNLIEFAFMSKSFSLIHFLVLLLGVLITLSSIILVNVYASAKNLAERDVSNI
ncbi:hypothetical protein TNCT_598602 [Trichonephila clavata]|uniref:Uncharacterized protein n=1 Tax=Trichonephila clavata TaxID=2740835 RepID=A0A8X6HQX7_TRICU|nr:hypothetical protein TNCT_598602 [Trichonephila clavata]